MMDYSEGDDGHMPVCRGVSSGDILHEVTFAFTLYCMHEHDVSS